MTDKLRVAVVGAGRWGLHHARVVSERSDTELCGIAGRSFDKTTARAEAFHTRAYTNIEAMIEAEKPDLVTLSLPGHEHYHATRTVMDTGTPLLVEKPLTFDKGEAEALIAEADRRKLFFGINFNHRYARPVQLARQAIADGKLGDMVFAHWRFGGDGGHDHPFNNLIETQCHGFDMLEFLCGPITSIMAQMTDKTYRGVYRTLALALSFKNGAVGTFLGSYDSSYAYPGAQAIELNGTRGRIVIEDTVRRYSFSPVDSEIAEVWQAGYFNDREREFHRTFDAHFDRVVANLRAGLPPPVHARAGLRALELALASIESFKSGSRVNIPDISDGAGPAANV